MHTKKVSHCQILKLLIRHVFIKPLTPDYKTYKTVETIQGIYLFSLQFPCRCYRIMVSLEYLPYYWKLFNYIWQLYTLVVGTFFHMLKFDL